MRSATVFCAFFACGMVAAQDTGSTGGGLAISIEQPTLAIRTMIRTQGTSNDSLGQIMMYAGSFPPTPINGWQPCAGQVLNITDNPALYAAIGSAYGGDGTTTFALPDLRGRAPVGTGTGAGLSAWAQGQTRGAETVTLTSQASLRRLEREQVQDEVHGARIIYQSSAEFYTVEGRAPGALGSDRVRMVIQPRRNGSPDAGGSAAPTTPGAGSPTSGARSATGGTTSSPPRPAVR